MEDILVQEHFQSGNLTSCSKIPHCLAFIHSGGVLTESDNCVRGDHTVLARAAAVGVGPTFYQHRQLSMKRDQLSPNALCEVQLPIVNAKHSFKCTYVCLQRIFIL